MAALPGPSSSESPPVAVKPRVKVVVENTTGAAGTIGVGRVARAAPDGYTIGIGHWSTHVVNPAIYTLTYDILEDFEPLAQNIQKFRYQVQANSDSVNFQTFTKNGNLYFELGEVSSHQGNFVFHQVKGNLADKMSWPVKQVLGILNLPGDKRMRISDVGVMQITVDSGVADYEYLIPAVSK